MEHVTVCICTYRRPQLLQRLLKELEEQETAQLFTFSIVIVDNDRDSGAKDTVLEFAAQSRVKIVYTVEPKQNIAMARNRAVSHAAGDFIAFIDDDEYPGTGWLRCLYETCKDTKADGVLGPVLPYFHTAPPDWAIRTGVFERPRHRTGYAIGLSDARTGNVLLRRQTLDGPEPFSPTYGSGGEDVDFFRRAMRKGLKFVWCDDAAVYELVPESRCSLKYLLRRALLRGQNSLKERRRRTFNVFKSLAAIPAYLFVIPWLFLCKSPQWLRYTISLFDHGGRVLAVVGLNPVKDRDC